MPADPHTEALTAGDEAVVAGTPVVVRRHAGLAALIGAGASAVAIAYLWRASQSMLALDWALCAVLTMIAATYLAKFVDSRTPLLVADALGVRIRLGREWRGLPWDAIRQVVVHPRPGLFRDGRIVFAPHSLARALEGVDGKGRRHVSLNQKMYGAPLAVPLGITTRVSVTAEQTIVGQIAALALGRAEVVELVPSPTPAPKTEAATEPSSLVEPTEPTEPTQPTEPTEPPAPAAEPVETETYDDPELETTEPPEVEPEETRPGRRTLLGGLGTIVSRVGKGRRNDVDGDLEGDIDEVEAPEKTVPLSPAASETLPLRTTRPALRAEVTWDVSPTQGSAALAEDLDERGTGSSLPEGRELRRPGSVNLVIDPVSDRVRPISTLGDPVEPLVIDDFVTEPAYDPVVGPELAAARTRVGLSVDELADRTRIRPHVIESIEVDDFGPCGGDFYARGHLRTLARVLGKDPVPLLEMFEDRYATAPINARRVFEAELATGMTGSMRSTIGGPNWGLLIGVVLSLVLVWGVARMFSGAPPEFVQNPAPVLNGSAGIDRAAPVGRQPGPAANPLPVLLVAAHADSRVVVRNGDGKIVFGGAMVLGEKKRLEVSPPVRVRARNGGAIEVTAGKKDKGVLGQIGEPAKRTFG